MVNASKYTIHGWYGNYESKWESSPKDRGENKKILEPTSSNGLLIPIERGRGNVPSNPNDHDFFIAQDIDGWKISTSPMGNAKILLGRRSIAQICSGLTKKGMIAETSKSCSFIAVKGTYLKK